MSKEKQNKAENPEVEFDRIMQAKFQGLLPEEDIPANLRQEVFNTLDTVELMAEVVDLFAVKFPMANLKYLGENEEDKTPEDEEQEKKKKNK